MAMEHKAFLFDDGLFHKELEPLLREALGSGDVSALEVFIDRNRKSLKDPNEGGSLPTAWKSLLSVVDVHQVGDIALTKYYDPRADVGLGPRWSQIDDVLQDVPDRLVLSLGQSIVGKSGLAFDPGKMGSYIQTTADVQNNIGVLKRLGSSDDEIREGVAPLLKVLEHAAGVGLGLYVTF